MYCEQDSPNPTVAGCLIANADPVDNALNPAWRDTTVHFHVAEVWSDSTPYTQTWVANDLMTNVRGAALRKLAPDTGAYYNEVCDVRLVPTHSPHGILS